MIRRATLTAAVLTAAAAGAVDWFGAEMAKDSWLAAVTYIQTENAVRLDTTGALPPQATPLAAEGDGRFIRFQLEGVRMHPDIYALAPHDGVIETIHLEAKKERGSFRVLVTVETAKTFGYDVERRQLEGGLSQIIFRLKGVDVKRTGPDAKDKVALRARAAADSQLVGYLPYHETVSVLDNAKNYYLVRTTEGALGWVPEKNVKIAGDNPFKPKEKAPPPADIRGKIIATAKKYLGVPYQWGGTSAAGFDCSGLVQTVFAENGVTLPRGAGDQYRQGKKVAVKDLRAGDLIFFHTYTSGPSHVGIWVGDGKFLHAESSPRGVTITPVDEPYWKERVLGGRAWLE